MERQYLTLALLLLAVTISTSAVTTTKHATLIISNADRSLTVDNYTIHGKTIVDSETKAIVKPKKNPDGSLTVEGKYTWYPNGTIVAPGVTIAVAGKASYVQIAMTRLYGIDGLARDATTNIVDPWIENDSDGSFTAGDITGWPNGTFLGTGTGGSTGTAHGQWRKHGQWRGVNPNGSVPFGKDYTLLPNGTAVDSSGKPVAPDGSFIVGAFTVTAGSTLPDPPARLCVPTVRRFSGAQRQFAAFRTQLCPPHT
ncbi:unnamed protein product [Closterium sp. NIES-54]